MRKFVCQSQSRCTVTEVSKCAQFGRLQTTNAFGGAGVDFGAKRAAVGSSTTLKYDLKPAVHCTVQLCLPTTHQPIATVAAQETSNLFRKHPFVHMEDLVLDPDLAAQGIVLLHKTADVFRKTLECAIW